MPFAVSILGAYRQGTLRSTLAERVFRWMRNQGVPRPGDRVGVAVSGGADSVALLLVLLELRKKLGIVLSVVHLNHKLRGRASDGDEKFVAKLAANHGLLLHAEQADVGRTAREKKANLEDTARRARYAFFQRVVEEEHVDWVAVAHTADDQAETVLGHILRGAGLAGLGGIHPVVGRVFRPLLKVRRAELRAYLRVKKQAWREDVTNRDTTKLRARIRRKLLPLLEKQFQAGVVEHLETLAELARDDEAFLDALATRHYEKVVQKSDERSKVRVADLIGQQTDNAETQSARRFAEERGSALSRRLIRLIVEGIKSRAGQLNAEHVATVLRLAAHAENGKSLQLPGGVRVRREHDALAFCKHGGNEKSKTQNENAGFEHAVELRDKETVVRVPELGCVFRFKAIDWPEKTEDTRYTGSALDRDALRSPLVLRNWRPGDQLHPIGHRNAHNLKRLLNQKRVDRWERHSWPILTSGGVLAWARGLPVAAEFAANERTRAGIVIVEEALS
jgi:tRNA(Ile)-lysidine synthase